MFLRPGLKITPHVITAELNRSAPPKTWICVFKELLIGRLLNPNGILNYYLGKGRCSSVAKLSCLKTHLAGANISCKTNTQCVGCRCPIRVINIQSNPVTVRIIVPSQSFISSVASVIILALFVLLPYAVHIVIRPGLGESSTSLFLLALQTTKTGKVSGLEKWGSWHVLCHACGLCA